MLFNTYTYGLFLPIVLIGYLRLPLRGRQIFLLAASYIFYCWEKPVYGLLLLTSTCLDFSCGLLMARLESRSRRRLVLLASVLGNLGLLGFFKYGDFLGNNIIGIGQLLGFDSHWKAMGFVLPIGISFYTFQTMSYTIQVYRRQIEPTRDIMSFALYVSFFPQLVAGPIERASNLLPQLQTYQRVTMDDIRTGLTRIIYGLFCKLVIADRLGILVDLFFEDPDAYSTLTAWIVLPTFMGQIYLDFAAYAGIAIGTARLFGIRLTENFRRPLLATSIGDFWNRWHITLTSWLRDYVFYPLGGFRKGGRRALWNGWVVLLLCGLWHGARWNFVMWGAYQAALVTCYFAWKYFKKHMGMKSPPRKKGISAGLIVSILCTFFFTSFNTVFFRSTGFPMIGNVFRALLGMHEGADLNSQWFPWVYLGMMAALLTFEFCQEHLGWGERLKRLHWSISVAGLTVLVIATILLSVNEANPYIYFQF